MITILPIPFRRRRKPPKVVAPAPPTELALVSAAFDVDALTLTLVFNQPIDIPSFEGAAVEVDDGDSGHSYLGVAATLVNPSTASITMVSAFPFSDPGVSLTATSETGIAASDGGPMWAGCADVPVPFP